MRKQTEMNEEKGGQCLNPGITKTRNLFQHPPKGCTADAQLFCSCTLVSVALIQNNIYYIPVDFRKRKGQIQFFTGFWSGRFIKGKYIIIVQLSLFTQNRSCFSRDDFSMI